MIDGGLRTILRVHIPDFHWQPIEVGTIGRGVPDSNYCGEGVEGWVECKKTNGWTVDLRKEQAAWIARRCRVGGRVTIAVRQKGGSRGERWDRIWLLDGQLAMLWRNVGLPKYWPLIPEPERSGVLCMWNGGPARWNWASVRHALTRKLPSTSEGNNLTL